MPETKLHDCYRLNWHYRLSNADPITLAHWYQCVQTPAVPATYPAYMLESYGNAIRNLMGPYLTNSVASVGLTSEKFDVDRRDVIEGFSVPSAWLGSVNLMPAPPTNAMTVQLRTGNVGRREIGKRYINGIAADWIIDNMWSGGGGPILQSRFAAVMRSTLADQGGAPGIIMRPVLPMRPVEPGPNLTLPEFVTEVEARGNVRVKVKFALDRRR